MKYIIQIALVVLYTFLLLGCSVGVSGNSNMKTNRQIVEQQRLEYEQEELEHQRKLEIEAREHEAEERAMTRMILMEQQRQRSYPSAPVTKFTEVRIKADADGPGQEPYAVKCGQSVRLDGTHSESDAGIPNIQWLITRGSLNRETTLTPTYTAPSCPGGATRGTVEETDITLIIEDTFGNRSSHTACITIMYPYQPGVIEDNLGRTTFNQVYPEYTGPENVVTPTPCYQTLQNGTKIIAECPPIISPQPLTQPIISPGDDIVIDSPTISLENTRTLQEPTCMDDVYLERLSDYFTALGYTEFNTCYWVTNTPTWMRADFAFTRSLVLLVEYDRSEEINTYAGLGYSVFPISKKMIDDEITRRSNEIYLFLKENVERPLLNEKGL